MHNPVGCAPHGARLGGTTPCAHNYQVAGKSLGGVGNFGMREPNANERVEPRSRRHSEPAQFSQSFSRRLKGRLAHLPATRSKPRPPAQRFNHVQQNQCRVELACHAQRIAQGAIRAFGEVNRDENTIHRQGAWAFRIQNAPGFQRPIAPNVIELSFHFVATAPAGRESKRRIMS